MAPGEATGRNGAALIRTGRRGPAGTLLLRGNGGRVSAHAGTVTELRPCRYSTDSPSRPIHKVIFLLISIGLERPPGYLDVDASPRNPGSKCLGGRVPPFRGQRWRRVVVDVRPVWRPGPKPHAWLRLTQSTGAEPGAPTPHRVCVFPGLWYLCQSEEVGREGWDSSGVR